MSTPMEGDVDGILADGWDHFDSEQCCTASGSQLHQLAMDEPIVPCCGRMDFRKRLWRQFTQLCYPLRLCARLVLGEHTPCREVERIVRIHLLGWGLMLYGVELCPTSGCRKAVKKQARRTRMISRWTWPEHTAVR